MGCSLGEVAGVVAVGAFTWWLLRGRRAAVRLEPGQTFHKASDHPIPAGFQIFEGYVPVHGVTHRQDEVRTFLAAEEPSLAFEPEPENQ
jgi:hypothetical protein